MWAGVRDSSELVRLQGAVERVTQEMGYAAEERKFSAHLTLGRVNQYVNPQQIQLCSKVILKLFSWRDGQFYCKIHRYLSQ